MLFLKNAMIYRAGVTARYLNRETTRCSAHIDELKKKMNFKFHLASKGGGTTSVMLEIGMDDLPSLLEELASKLPESVGVLSDCAAIANKKNLELLDEARKLRDDEKARANSFIDDLETVEEFVSEKYLEAPPGEDEREKNARNQIQKVIGSLRSLR